MRLAFSQEHLLFSGSVTVNGGYVSADGGGAVSTTGSVGSYGVYAKDVTVNGGSLIASGEPSEATDATVQTASDSADDFAEGIGIYAYGALTVNGGSVSGGGGWAKTSGKANAYSYGIYAGSMTVTDGEITANAYFSNAVNGDAHSYGIYTADALTVSGGKLTAEGNGATVESQDGDEHSAYSTGIYAFGPVSITGGEVCAVASAASSIYGSSSSTGLYTRKTLSVTGGTLATESSSATIPFDSGIAGSAYTYGIRADGEVSIRGTVTAAAGVANGKQKDHGEYEAASYGLYTPAQLTVSGGKLTATGGAAVLAKNQNSSNIYSYGVYAKDMAVSGSAVVTATGDTASKSYGVKTARTLSVSGGSVTAIGKDTDSESAGIYATEALTLSGGTVKATGGNVDSSNSTYSAGIHTNRLTVSGGTVAEATGGDVLSESSYATAESYGIIATVMSVSGGTIEGVRCGSASAESEGSHAYTYKAYALNLDVSGGTIDAELTGNTNVAVSGGAVQTLVLADSAAPFLTGGTFGEIQYAELKNALADGYAYFTKTEGSEDYDTIVKVNALGQYDKDHPLETVQIKKHECDFGEAGNVHGCAVCGRGENGSKEPVEYLDRNGDIRQCVNYTAVTGETTTLENGWYVVNGKVTAGEIAVKGNVHLILCDDAELKATQIKYVDQTGTFANLTVYAQSEAANTMGRLTVENTEDNSIFLSNGVLTVAGGSISATTASGNGIQSELNLLGGSVTAKGTGVGLQGGTITVSGGELTATATGGYSNADGIFCTSMMTVTGGKVYATGGSSERADSRGISLMFRSLTVSGNGEVYATGGQNSDSYGIHGSDQAGVIVTDNGKLTATGGTATNGDSCGIYLCQDLTVSGNGVVTATGGEATNGDSYGFYGVYAPNLGYSASLIVSGSGVVTATGGDATNRENGESCGVYSQGRIGLSDSGKITATAGTSDGESSGIRCDRELTVSGGTLTAQSGEATGGSSYGIYVTSSYAPMTVYGGAVTATGGEDSDTGSGIRVNGDLIVYGGEVTATGKDAAKESYGVFASASYIDVYGGKVTAQSGELTGEAAAQKLTSAFRADHIKMGNGMGVTSPTGGKVQYFKPEGEDHYYAVADSTGEAVTKAVIATKPDTPSVDNGGNSGNGGGSSSNTTGTTVKNPDGSTTTTTTNKKTGEVTETTKNPNGTTGTTVTDKDGNVTDISAKVPSSAVKDGESVTIPIDKVKPAEKSEDAPEIKIDVPAGGATVVIPVENPTPGTVIVIVDKNGNETVVPGSKVTENGIEVTLPEDATVKVIENGKTFSDVKASDYFADAVAWASSRGITGGVGGGLFGADLSCTRAQLVTFLWRAAGQPEAKSGSSLTDVVADSFYAEAVAWAFENGIVGGYGNGLFGSEDTITREQMALILYRFAQHIGMDTTQGGMAVREYKDYESISDYAVAAIQWAVNAGIMQGYDGNLMPNQPCTRAQIVTMLYRLLG